LQLEVVKRILHYALEFLCCLLHHRQKRGLYEAGQRVRAGQQAAKARGVKFGRRPDLTEVERADALKRRAAGETLGSIAGSYGVHPTTIGRTIGRLRSTNVVYLKQSPIPLSNECSCIRAGLPVCEYLVPANMLINTAHNI
jgi:hypothetical protein